MRVAGLAYQQGFGGHFHNDNSVAVLRDIPGLVLAVPARADDAAPMLRTCLAAAAVDGSVCVFLEPIALYHTRDLYADGDGEWLAPYLGPAAVGRRARPDRPRPGLHRAAPARTSRSSRSATACGCRCGSPPGWPTRASAARVVDLRWLAPLPVADMIREASATGRVLVVDETRRSGGVGEGVLAALVDAGYVGSARRIAAVDSFVPLGPGGASRFWWQRMRSPRVPGPCWRGRFPAQLEESGRASVRHCARLARRTVWHCCEYVDELREARRQ